MFVGATDIFTTDQYEINCSLLNTSHNNKVKHYNKKKRGKKIMAADKDLKKLHQFLKDAGTYYLATEDGDTPRVRPFGTALLFEDKIYILTAKAKNVSRQIEKNPKFELSVMDKDDRWIRVSGKLKEDNRIEVHYAILEEYPHLKNAYTAGDDNTNTLYLDIDNAVIYSFTEEPEILKV